MITVQVQIEAIRSAITAFTTAAAWRTSAHTTLNAREPFSDSGP